MQDTFSRKRILLLGAGFGNIRLVQRLAPLIEDGLCHVTLVSDKHTWTLGALIQYVFNERIDLDHAQLPLAKLKGVPESVVRRFGEEVVNIDVDERKVDIRNVETGVMSCLEYDYLVCGMGVSSKKDAIPGMDGCMFDISNEYSMQELRRHFKILADRWNTLKSESTVPPIRFLFQVARMPYKCAPAPFEYLFLTNEFIKDTLKTDVKATISHPLKFPFGNPSVHAEFKQRFKEWGIEHRPESIITEIIPSANGEKHSGIAVYEDGSRVEFDVAVGTFVQKPPKCVRQCRIATKSGFIPVNPWSMRFVGDGDDVNLSPSDGSHAIFAIGDNAECWVNTKDGVRKRHPMAGGFAITHADTVSQQLDALVRAHAVQGEKKLVDITKILSLLPEKREAYCAFECGHSEGFAIERFVLPYTGMKLVPISKKLYQEKQQYLKDKVADFFDLDEALKFAL